jgi:hypothetical protein
VRKIGVIVAALAVGVMSMLAAVLPASAASANGPVAGEAALVPQVQGPPGKPPTSGKGTQIAPDPSGYARCEDADVPLWTPYFEDRFHSCFLVHSGFDVVVKKDGVSVKVGSWTLLWIVTGSGSNGLQSMTFKVQSRVASVDGVPPKPTWEWSIGLACLNYFGATCSNTHAAGYTEDVAEWSVPQKLSFVFITRKSPGYRPTMFYSAADKLNYHAMSQWQMFPGNLASKSWSNPVYFRGDAANYVGGASYDAGSLYYQVIPTWDLSLSTKAKEVAQNIQQAETNPGTGTYPPGPGGKKVRIPGFASTGEPLTRLNPSYEPVTYADNRKVSNAACVAKWGAGYSDGGKYECDEYPMAATFEGASLAFGNPWWYTVKVVTGSANSSASGYWNSFLKQNRVLSGDQFWVAIVS